MLKVKQVSGAGGGSKANGTGYLWEGSPIEKKNEDDVWGFSHHLFLACRMFLTGTMKIEKHLTPLPRRRTEKKKKVCPPHLRIVLCRGPKRPCRRTFHVQRCVLYRKIENKLVMFPPTEKMIFVFHALGVTR